jgi:hypothetical protein
MASPNERRTTYIMSLPRISWRRSLRLRNPSTPFIVCQLSIVSSGCSPNHSLNQRRNTQAAYTPLQDHASAVGLSIPPLDVDQENEQFIRHNGIRNPRDNPQRTAPLYSPNGLRIAWDDYHGSLIHRINELTAGMKRSLVYGMKRLPLLIELLLRNPFVWKTAQASCTRNRSRSSESSPFQPCFYGSEQSSLLQWHCK